MEEGRFEARPLPIHATVIAAGDYDNDGVLDLFADGLYRNDGLGNFTRATRADVSDALFFDFDNDGWLDLITSGSGGLTLLHNDAKGHFTDKSALLPVAVKGTPARRLLSFDYDNDGDLDLVVVGLGGRGRVLRNDGGNVNQFVNVGLVAWRDGSGKNSTFGIGSGLELRVVWTNGVPQSFSYPVSQSMLEQQVLKGSCTFLYTWDGQAYRFLTDVTWASALGMPLGIMAGEKTVYGPPQAAREYFRIPGDRLKAVNGRYRMQLTEELWEVAYVDQLELVHVRDFP